MHDPLGLPDSVVPLPRSQQSAPATKEALVALNFRVPFELRQRIKLAAATRGITMTQLLSAAFERYFEYDAPRNSIQRHSSSPDACLVDEILHGLKK